jgi:predicted PurR-regulated permease PerM
MKLCGLGDPILWGVMAFLLNYIPVLGPMTGVLIFFVAGLVERFQVVDMLYEDDDVRRYVV